MDYRDIPTKWTGRFDAFVSVEMVEVSTHFLSPSAKLIRSFHNLQHVGTQHYKTYFKLVNRALKDRNATTVVTSSTFPEACYKTYQPEDFVRCYMWPNGALPCTTALINAATKASKNRSSVQSVENHKIGRAHV